jgi:RNA polymerase primary sigma factor
MAHHTTSLGKAFLQDLLDKANLQGYLTMDDIFDSFQNPGGQEISRGRLIAILQKQGVEVWDNTRLPAETALPENLTGQWSDRTADDAHANKDTVDIYLKEMAQVPLLNFAEEISLAKRIETGRAARTNLTGLKKDKNSSQRRLWEAQVEDGLQAREHIIKANTRLVVSIAKKYMGRGVPFLDLIQEGNLGLMKAVEKYDYQRGFRFSTYATWWIRQTITRSIADQGRTIRLPVHMSDRIRQINRASQALEQANGRPPSAEELADHLQIPSRKMQWMLQVARIPLSLESPVGDEDDSELGMFLEDQQSPSPSQVAYQNMLRERVEEVLSDLTPREARVIRMRFGLDDNHPYTLEEVGAKFGLTRERIRQIEGKALRRMRHPCYARKLRDYL